MALSVGKQIIYLNFNNMTDIKIMVEAVRQLNRVWSSYKRNEEVANDVYNALCDIDEAVTNLVEKVGEAVRTITIYEIFKNR